ncbi:uncharacterized protein TA19980 [Theileria annulata]|uniref:Uncharacterized protein n=1 Tax=Theileria annulata TaxID=5874 RepID=Q4UG41_THEAN|nr:uncharacterized protein TA19980 [Theileria annulata]CAI73948.1 hypothetical protein TA19980 [Theileria annulata]|eukprot:XP_954625.1 hypothetical protein TA19980 [Theileria annulata]
MTGSGGEFSISEFQKLSEYVSSSDESGESEPEPSASDVPEHPNLNHSESSSSDEEIDVNLNDLQSLVTESKPKSKHNNLKDIEALFSKSKLNLKEENELKMKNKQKAAQLMRHFSKFKDKKEEVVEEVTFKEWHVPLMEIPTRGNLGPKFKIIEEEPKPKRKKQKDNG